MIIAVTGSRRFTDRAAVFATLDALIPADAFLHLGDATGVDAFAREWAERRAPDRFRMFKANWHGYGRAAGPMRNGAMLAGAERLIAFLEGAGPGTRDCIAQAERLRIPVVSVPAALEAPRAAICRYCGRPIGVSFFGCECI